MSRWLLTGILISFQLITFAQTISGIIRDIDGKPVQGAHVYCYGTSTGEVSDVNGHYTFNASGKCPRVVISHINFEQRDFAVEDLSKNPDIVLKDMSYNISPVDIYSKPIIPLLPDTPLFVNDYEIVDDRIFMCAFFQRKLNNSVLLYTDLNGKIIDSKTLSESGVLYKDPNEEMYITQKDYAFQLFTGNNRINFSEPFKSTIVLNAREHWTHSIGDSLVLQYYYYRNQGVGYFIRNLPNDSTVLFLKFIDEDAYGRMTWGSYFDGSEFDQRFEELIVYKPVQIPIFFREKDIVAFNFITWKIEYFDHQGESISETEMQFGEKTKLQKEIYYDKVTNKYYGREVRNGLNSLIEIDISTGKATKYFTFKGYPHIEKLKVSDGVLYFLYKDYAGDEYKRLYKSPLIKMVAGR